VMKGDEVALSVALLEVQILGAGASDFKGCALIDSAMLIYDARCVPRNLN
jgi:hypothetical protein